MKIGICRNNTVAYKYILKNYKNHLVGFFANDSEIVKALDENKINFGIIIGGFNNLDLTKNIELVKKIQESQINILTSINISESQPVKIYTNHNAIAKIILHELRINIDSDDKIKYLMTNDYNIADIVIYVDSNPNKFISHLTKYPITKKFEYLDIPNLKINNNYIREFIYDLHDAIKNYPNIVIPNKHKYYVKSFYVQNILLRSRGHPK